MEQLQDLGQLYWIWATCNRLHRCTDTPGRQCNNSLEDLETTNSSRISACAHILIYGSLCVRCLYHTTKVTRLIWHQAHLLSPLLLSSSKRNIGKAVGHQRCAISDFKHYFLYHCWDTCYRAWLLHSPDYSWLCPLVISPTNI
jgi:hypothetical protein